MDLGILVYSWCMFRSLISECRLELTEAGIRHGGEVFRDYNKPQRTPGHSRFTHAVLAKDGKQTRLIRFGQKGGEPKLSLQAKINRDFRANREGKLSDNYWLARHR